MAGMFTTDGATLPKFFRRWIVRHYGQPTMDLIDRGGEFHDWLVWKHRDKRNTRTHNRRRFIRLLRRYGVPVELRLMINCGLFVYDVSPQWLRTRLQASAR